jgi:hypothetical protein
MKVTKDILKAAGLHNSHTICQRGGSIYVTFFPASLGMSAKWQVIKPNGKTDPNAHWSDYGNKTFDVYGRPDKEAKRLEAIQWASFVYNTGDEWERDPFGGYHPKGTIERALNRVEVKA